MALEYGQKVLGDSEILNYITNVSKSDTISPEVFFGFMIYSSEELQRNQDAMKYKRELLKISVNRYNKGEIDQCTILKSYLRLIKSQIDNKASDEIFLGIEITMNSKCV